MPRPLKPPALRQGDAIRVLSLASPVQEDHLRAGCEEITRLGFVPKADCPTLLAHESFFAGGTNVRLGALQQALDDPAVRGIFCSRGGYGSNYLLDGLSDVPAAPKIILGSSDITSLQIFLWQKFGWVTFYGPMVATNFDKMAGAPHGYDRFSLLSALAESNDGWKLDLQGKALVAGSGEGILLGGCLTLIETTLGTPWEIDTRGTILLLEDRGMKPYQVDRALMHLKQAGKFEGVAGIVLGEFPDCDPPAGGEFVRDVAQRILAPLKIPVVWGAPVGHTSRAALTLPLGVRARLTATAAAGKPTQLEILEPACSP